MVGARRHLSLLITLDHVAVVSAVLSSDPDAVLNVSGRDLVTGLPRRVLASAGDVAPPDDGLAGCPASRGPQPVGPVADERLDLDRGRLEPNRP